MFKFLFWALVIALVVAAFLMWTLVRPALFARRVERARRQFARDRQKLESAFFEKAASSGKPHGLAWKSCAFQDGVLLARDRANGELVGLVGVTIGFEAIAGGGMEDVEAVGNLRAATAVFTRDGREWTTSGRAVFNLEPRVGTVHAIIAIAEANTTIASARRQYMADSSLRRLVHRAAPIFHRAASWRETTHVDASRRVCPNATTRLIDCREVNENAIRRMHEPRPNWDS